MRVPQGQKNEGDQCLGRSRGGFSTKLHGLADSLGNPICFALTAGQAGDAPQAIALLATIAMVMVAAVLADRAYDSDAIVAWIIAQGAIPVIPPHPSRAATRKTDLHRCKERARIECLFRKMKHFRRVFSRIEKLSRRYLAFVHFVAAYILLR